MLVREIEALDAAITALDGTPPSTTDPIVPTARYRLSEAASFLRTSERTLKRRHDDRTRAAAQRPVILWDGKTPYMTGAEILRYAREAARPRPMRPARRAA
jgi:hypothetical protein